MPLQVVSIADARPPHRHPFPPSRREQLRRLHDNLQIIVLDAPLLFDMVAALAERLATPRRHQQP